MSKIADKELISSFKMKVSKSMNEGGIRGLSAALIRKAGPIWLESFGFTDTSKRQKVDVNTLFGLQSTTKTVTAVVFLLAVQAGLVRLDDPIVKYYPEFRMKSIYGDDEYKKITFKHLLHHMGSLPMGSLIGGCFSREVPKSFEEHIKGLNDRWLQNPVGTSFMYSNIGMDLVPYVLERIAKKPYSKLVQELLGNKLGITYYWTKKERDQRENVVTGYLSDYVAHKLDDVGFGCGAAFISLKDQAIFVQFLLNKGKHNGEIILQSKYFEMLREPFDEFTYYGLGTFITVKYGTKLYQHAGGGFGLGSEMYWLPEFDIGVIILYNNENAFYSNYSPRIAIREFLEEYLSKSSVDASTTKFEYADKDIIDVPAEKLRRLVGTYIGVDIIFKIYEENGILYYQVGDYKLELTSHTELAFTTTKPNGIIFELDEQGLPKGCKLYHSTEGILYCKYQKIEKKFSPQEVKEEWKKHIGFYYFNYYYTEYNFTPLKMDDEGFLVIGDSRLVPHETEENIFVTDKGVVVEILDDSFIYNNILYTKVENVVDFFTNIVDNEPNHRAGLSWIFDAIINNLKQLGNSSEANKIIELKKKLQERKN
ncbi:MAG: class A beta-lactamase-related serine hydrolase [Candidatus Heimdallarchaeota archaeon]|nr:class A beta-lactamase-related serine hydrolase [Candidatus Heimdallarchaeota archaeon]